jgi:putative transposase
VLSGQPTIVFLTVCTHNRQPWLAQTDAHAILRDAWQKAHAWLVGYYLLMPDHLHLFCAPHDLTVTLDNWVTYWKRMFTRAATNPDWAWQSGHWDTRLRRTENYQEKWAYIRENPLRKGLVTQPDDWPYQGMLNALRW